MNKLLIYCFTAISSVTVLVSPVVAADDSVMPQLHSMDLSAMPLVSRSLSSFKSPESIADPATTSNSYQPKRASSGTGAAWLFASLAEPFICPC